MPCPYAPGQRSGRMTANGPVPLHDARRNRSGLTPVRARPTRRGLPLGLSLDLPWITSFQSTKKQKGREPFGSAAFCWKSNCYTCTDSPPAPDATTRSQMLFGRRRHITERAAKNEVMRRLSGRIAGNVKSLCRRLQTSPSMRTVRSALPERVRASTPATSAVPRCRPRSRVARECVTVHAVRIGARLRIDFKANIEAVAQSVRASRQKKRLVTRARAPSPISVWS